MAVKFDPEKLRKDLGGRIRAFRHSAGLTQAELGDLAQIGNEFLSRLEHGRGSPSLDTLGRLAAALGVPLSELFASEEPPAPLKRSARRIERALYRAQEDDAELLAGIAEQVARHRQASKEKKK
ncbi:MAG: helix-turn-helix transcriptional regulator [Bdellovibrionota bacterium]